MPHRIGIVGMAHPRLVPRVRIQTAGHGEIVERLAFYQGQIQLVRVADALGPIPAAFAAIGTGCEHKAGGRRVQAVEQA